MAVKASEEMWDLNKYYHKKSLSRLSSLSRLILAIFSPLKGLLSQWLGAKATTHYAWGLLLQVAESSCKSPKKKNSKNAFFWPAWVSRMFVEGAVCIEINLDGE